MDINDRKDKKDKNQNDMHEKWEKRKKQHSGSLKSFFLRYLTSVVVSLFFVLVIYIIIMGISLSNGLLLPANMFPKLVDVYENTIEAGKDLDLHEIPPEISYIVFDDAGKVEETTFSNKELNHFWEWMKEGRQPGALSSLNLQKQYRVVQSQDKTYIFIYYITAEFASPTLRRIFPHVEWTLVMFLIFLFVLDILVISILYAGRLGKKVKYMKQAADQIRERKLEFSVPNTGIKEFDTVMSSLDDLKENLNTSLSNQWKLEQQKKDQMGALAHDIKTPLTVIRGNAELLMETDLTEEQKDYLSYISNNVERIGQYISELIEISKGQTEVCNRKPVQINTFMKELRKQLLSLFECKHLLLESENNITSEQFSMDPELCTRAIMNLADNAAQYSPVNGRIYLNTYEDSDFYYFSIQDEGKGFSKEDLKCATNEFYQADPSRNMNGHYGMGLYIAKQIATLHEGKIELRNGDKGAEVILSISKMVN